MPKGYPVNPEKTFLLRSIAAKNRVWTKEHRENVKNMLIKRNKDPKHIKKVIKGLMDHPCSEETREKIRKNQPSIIGEKNPRWQGGWFINKFGYKFIYSPNHKYTNLKGYVREHFFVLYKLLGDKIKSSNVIHHIDGNKSNNSIKNLMIMKDAGAHRRIHCNRTIKGDVLFNGSKYKGKWD